MSPAQYETFLKDLERKRAPAMAAAERLLQRGECDEADRIVRAADDSIYGAVSLAKLYTERLRRVVSEGRHRSDPAFVEDLFKRALLHRFSAYPDPHTQYEADDFAEGRRRDRAELVAILGYDPSQKR